MAFLTKKAERQLIEAFSKLDARGMRALGSIAALVTIMKILPSLGEPQDTVLKWAFVVAVLLLLGLVLFAAAFRKAA